jgi:phosphate:Na+ symporter
MAAAGEVQLFPLISGLLGGLALFLFGMDLMARSLKTVAAGRMKVLLTRLTTNRWMGVLTGAFVTAVIQSSSVTTVLVVGFITSGIMSLSQSVGVIMGANIGTTVTAQIIAFKVTRYALLLVAIGFGIAFAAKREILREYGTGIMGVGLIFVGMGIMGDAMAPLRTFQPFLDLMVQLESPVLGILAGAVLTALVQASAATTGVVIVLASQGLVTLPAGIAVIFGANVGTCVTAMLAAIGKPREALRAAVVHVLFNVIGVVIWVAFIDQLAALVTWLSPQAAGLTGAAKLAAETPRQIANAHTVFNVSNTLLLVPFATQFARLVEFLVPDRPLEEEEIARAKYLDDELLMTPALALDRARLEILNMGDRVTRMFNAILPALMNGNQEMLKEVAEADDQVDVLHGQIVTYLGRISQIKLSEVQTEELFRLMEAANDLENIGDVIETNLVRLGLERIEDGVKISAGTRHVLSEFHAQVGKALDAALQAVTQKSENAARFVLEMKDRIYRLADSAAVHETQRLVAAEPNRLAAYTTEIDVLENLKRIYYFSRRMARAAIPPHDVSGDLLRG